MDWSMTTMNLPTRNCVAFDRSRKDKKVQRAWKSPVDDDARIVKLKDGRRTGHATNTADLESGFVALATVQHGTGTDSQTLCDAVISAQENLDRADYTP